MKKICKLTKEQLNLLQKLSDANFNRSKAVSALNKENLSFITFTIDKDCKIDKVFYSDLLSEDEKRIIEFKAIGFIKDKIYAEEKESN